MNSIRLLSTVRGLSLSKVLSSQYSSHHPLRFTEVQDKWRQQDNVSKSYQLIYKSPMEKTLNYATAYLTFSTTTVACLGAYYAAFVYDAADLNNPVVLGDDVVIANSAVECFSYLGAFVLFHAAVKILLSKYVLRLYQDNDRFIAVFRGHFFNTIRKHDFKLKDVEKLSPTLIVSWSDSRFSLGGKHAILLEQYFKTPEYYNQLLKKEQEDDEEEKSS